MVSWKSVLLGLLLFSANIAYANYCQVLTAYDNHSATHFTSLRGGEFARESDFVSYYVKNEYALPGVASFEDCDIGASLEGREVVSSSLTCMVQVRKTNNQDLAKLAKDAATEASKCMNGKLRAFSASSYEVETIRSRLKIRIVRGGIEFTIAGK